MTICKLLSRILVSPPNPKVVTAVDGVITGYLGSILFDFFYRNYSSNCVTERYSSYYGTSYY